MDCEEYGEGLPFTSRFCITNWAHLSESQSIYGLLFCSWRPQRGRDGSANVLLRNAAAACAVQSVCWRLMEGFLPYMWGQSSVSNKQKRDTSFFFFQCWAFCSAEFELSFDHISSSLSCFVRVFVKCGLFFSDLVTFLFIFKKFHVLLHSHCPLLCS